MVTSTDSRPAFAAPIPPIDVQIQRLMLATAMLVDGHLETAPGQIAPYLENCYLLTQANIVLAGTTCLRPAITQQFADVCGVASFDGLLVRLTGSAEQCQPSFDIHSGSRGTVLQHFRLWMPEPQGDPWLIGTAGEKTFVRLDPSGLDFATAAPFAEGEERASGLRHAARFLSVALQGWF